MEKKTQLAYNLRFNANNERHVNAAETLAMIAPRYKSSFVALAIETYIDSHPNGVDMNELLAIGKSGRRSYQPKSGIVENLNKQEDQAAREQSQLSDRMIDSALDFYNIE